MTSSAPRPDLVLLNANAITLNDYQPRASLVAIAGGRIVWVGSNEDLTRLEWRGARVIDCEGLTLVPGFIDSHCHLMAYAASLLAVDCRPGSVDTITGIQHAIRERARHTPAGQWIRGSGYDDSLLLERRHPTRHDLDAAASGHPVRLNHRSGHACVLNSAALADTGISATTPDPVEGVIEREAGTGEPTGLLFEMDALLDGRIPPLSDRDLQSGVRLASERLTSLGITSVQDATHSNSVQRWEALARLKSAGILLPRVTVMAGANHVEGFLTRGMGFRSGDHDLNLGAAKIMLTLTTGAMYPSPEELTAMTLRAHEAGFPVAVHAVEREAVEAAIHALLEARPRSSTGYGDRIEHCSECPPELLARLQGSGIRIVTQPGFLYYSGQRYLSEVAEDTLPWLYGVGSLLEAGVHTAAGSDAPVIDPNPLVGIYAAVTRKAESGQVVGGDQGLPALEALRMYTLAGAQVSFQEADKGSIEVGKLADLTLLDQDPTWVEVERIRSIRATLTLIGGRVVWQSG